MQLTQLSFFFFSIIFALIQGDAFNPFKHGKTK